MRSTMDKAGRIVIPARARLGLVPGPIDLVVDGAGLRIDIPVADDVVERDGFLMLDGDGPELTADSALTRLPGEQRVSAAVAVRIVEANFPATVGLAGRAAAGVPRDLAAAGVSGEATYDGLVGLAAKDAGVTLVTCDRRAQGTNEELGVDIEVL